MFKLFRNIDVGEVFVVGGDCAQGGEDENFAHFFSKTKLDIPLVYQRRGVAADMTVDLLPVLEWLYNLTGKKPLVAFERNNGGASEMQRLFSLNRDQKFAVYVMPKQGLVPENGQDPDTNKLGYETNVATRPKIVGDLNLAIRDKLFTFYDQATLDQLKTFIVNKNGKPEAARGKRDDAVMSLAIAWQLAQSVDVLPNEVDEKNKRMFGENYEHVNDPAYWPKTDDRKWRFD